MTRTEIIELANQLSERKAEKVLNLQSIYRICCQDICKRERFWWRRLVFSFPLVAGTPIYDLTQVTTVPSTAMTELLLDEITKFTIILTPNPLQVAELTPLFDPEALIEMILNMSATSPSAGTANGNAPGGRYTMDPTGINTVRIDPPDLNYTAYVVGWAMPNPGSDSTNDQVPLIPPWGHNAIVKKMVWEVFKFAYGSQNEKTDSAEKDYEIAIADLQQRRKFDPNYNLQLTSTEAAVRST